MASKVITILLIGIIASGLIYTHPVFAHNFASDKSAIWLAKSAEIKTEVGIVAKHVGDTNAINYYSNELGIYWNANDSGASGGGDASTRDQITSEISTILSDAANAGNQNMVNDDVSKLTGYLDGYLPGGVYSNTLSNSTIQALAVTLVLKESLADYGTAINSTTDLNDMSKMKMDDNMSGGSMSGGMTMMSTIVDQNAYENSLGLATMTQNMFKDVATGNPDKSDANAKVTTAFTKLLQDINAKADGNTVMMDVHTNIHPPLIDAYQLPLVSGASNPQSAVPEFPIPALLIIVSITGVIAATSFRSRLGF